MLMDASSMASNTMQTNVAANTASNNNTQQHTVFFGLAL